MKVVWQDVRAVRQAEHPKPRAGVEVRVLDATEVLAATLDPELDLEPGFAPAALAKGDLCVGVYEAGELASYGWYAQTRTEVAFGIHLEWDAPRVRYMYKGFTRPSRRARGLYTVGLVGAALVISGVDTIFALIRRGNVSSLIAAERAGYESMGTCALTGHFGGRAFMSTAARARGLRVVSSRRT